MSQNFFSQIFVKILILIVKVFLDFAINYGTGKSLLHCIFPWFHETISANLNVYVIKFISYNTPTKALIKLKEAILNKKKTSISITNEITDELI